MNKSQTCRRALRNVDHRDVGILGNQECNLKVVKTGATGCKIYLKEELDTVGKKFRQEAEPEVFMVCPGRPVRHARFSS